MVIERGLRPIRPLEDGVPQKEALRVFTEEYIRHTAITAIDGYRYVKARRDTLGREPNSEEIQNIKDGMDRLTDLTMRNQLDGSEAQSIIRGGEGKKDNMPYLSGVHGRINGPMKEIIVDPIDGTTLLAGMESGAVSWISGSEEISDVPEDYNHAVSITVPPEAREAASLHLTKEGHIKTLKNICEALNIFPSELTQVMLDPSKKGREINAMYAQAAVELGVKPHFLKAGDPLQKLYASLSGREVEMYCHKYNLDPKIYGKYKIVVGRTGHVEHHGANVATSMTNAASIAYNWHKEIDKIDTKNVFTHKSTVPGHRDTGVVAVTFATPSELFGQQGIIDQGDGYYTATSLVLTAQKGLEFFTKTHRVPPLVLSS